MNMNMTRRMHMNMTLWQNHNQIELALMLYYMHFAKKVTKESLQHAEDILNEMEQYENGESILSAASKKYIIN